MSNSDACLGKEQKTHLLIELCPLRELRRLSTDPPALSLGFSRESVSGWGDWGQLGVPSVLDYTNKKKQEKLKCIIIYKNKSRKIDSRWRT